MDLELLSAVLLIVGIDVVLGGDNAIVIALASRNLPEQQRNKAIFLGTGLAIIIRIVLTVLAVYLLTIPYLQLVGGLLLIMIAFKLLVDEDETANIKAGATLGAAVKTIVFADVVMGLDNVIAVAGAAHGNIFLVVLGLIVSVPIIVWGSKIILHFMERFPSLVYIGAGILGYTAGKMITHEKRLFFLLEQYPSLSYIVPIVTVILVLASGYIVNRVRMKESYR